MNLNVLVLDELQEEVAIPPEIPTILQRATGPLAAAYLLDRMRPDVLLIACGASWPRAFVQAIPESRRPAVLAVGIAAQPLAHLADEWIERGDDSQELRNRLTTAIVRARTRRQTARKVSIDAATGLPNRRGLVRALAKAGRKAARGGGPLSLTLIAIEGLHVGDPREDGRLKAVASVLRSTVRAEESLGRLGGCEFAVIVRGGIEDAARVGARARELLFHGGMVASVGVAELKPGERLKDLYRRCSRSLVESMRRVRTIRCEPPRMRSVESRGAVRPSPVTVGRAVISIEATDVSVSREEATRE